MIKQILRNLQNYFLKNNGVENIYKNYAQKHDNVLQVDGFFTKYDAEYLEKGFEIVKNKLAEIVKKNDTVIEVGCGTGKYLKHLESIFKNEIKLYGIDITKETIINITQKNVGSDVILIIGDFIKNESFHKEQFDFIYSIATLQHFPFFRLNTLFNKIEKHLKRGGKAYIVFAPKRNRHSNFINNFLDFNFTAHDPEIILRKIRKKFVVLEKDYIHIDSNCFGYYILFKKE